MVKFFEGLPLFPSRCVLTLRGSALDYCARAHAFVFDQWAIAHGDSTGFDAPIVNLLAWLALLLVRHCSSSMPAIAGTMGAALMLCGAYGLVVVPRREVFEPNAPDRFVYENNRVVAIEHWKDGRLIARDPFTLVAGRSKEPFDSWQP